MPIPVEKRIARYNAWRQREPMERPMFGLAWEPDVYLPTEALERFGEGNWVVPSLIHPEEFLECIERAYQEDCGLQSDIIQSFAPAFGIPWVEAMAGCPVVAQPGSLWAEAFLDSYDDRPAIRYDPENPWLRKLIEFTCVLVQHSGGRYPVSLPLMRGPLDTLSAMRGPRRMCLDLVDRPGEVHQILNELTELWIGVAEACLRWIPPFHGGYCTRMKMWAPGPAVTPQNDISALVSARTYGEFALPYDRRIVERFPYHSFHLHSPEYHQIDPLLKLEGLTAIQIFLQHDSGGPPVGTVMPALKRCLAAKPLLLGTQDLATTEQCLRELPSAGLCVMLPTNNDGAIPEDHKRWLESHCKA